MPLAVRFIHSSLWGGLPAHKVFQDGALACTLAAHHGDLRQVEAAGLPHAAQGIL